MPEGTHSFDFQGPQDFWGKQQSTVLKRRKSSSTQGSCLGTSSLSKMPLNSTTNPHPQWRVWICLKCQEVFWNKVLLKSSDFTKDSQSGWIRINFLLVKAFFLGGGDSFPFMLLFNVILPRFPMAISLGVQLFMPLLSQPFPFWEHWLLTTLWSSISHHTLTS